MTETELCCPACRTSLERADVELSVWTCGRCGGVWADQAASERIATVMDPDLVLVGRRAAKSAAGDSAFFDGARVCPVCGKPLERTKVAEVSLDACDPHGTFYDRDELGRVARNLDYERKSHDAIESEPDVEPRETPTIGLLRFLLGRNTL